MARLDTRTDVQLLKLAGTLVQNFTNSMEKQSSIKRENGKPENKLGEDFTKKESIVILRGQENTINQFFTFISQRNKTAAMRLPLFTTEPYIGSQKKKIQFGSITAPPNVEGKLGDIAEGVFAAALAARFTKRANFNTDPATIKNIIRSLSVNTQGNIATYSGTAPNFGLPESQSDRIILKIVLKKMNMAFLTNPINIDSLAQYYTSAIQFADRQSVKDWVKTIYHNRRIDTVEITADGVSGATSTKIDVQVKITNNTGVLSGVNINSSLKVDDTKLFGQVSGNNFSAVSTFFSKAFREDMVDNQSGFERETDGAKKMEFIYKQAQIKLQAKLDKNPRQMNFIIGTGIKQFATSNNAGVKNVSGGYVEMIDLNMGEATIYDFRNVASKLSDYKFNSFVKVGKSGLPTIVIEEADTKQILVQYRSMVQNLEDTAGMPKLYYRNYVEKGPFLKKLIGSAALENPVTSS